MTLKKPVLVFLGVSFLLSAKAQHNELSYHLSPHILSGTRLEVNSPIITETNQFGAMGGVNFARFSESDLGIRFGLNFGILRSKFDTQNSSYPKIWGPIIGYGSLNMEGVKRFKIGKPVFEVFGGGDLRYFNNNGYSSYGFNSEPTTPGTVNVYDIVLPPFDNKFQTNLYGGISYVRQFKGKSRIIISAVKNFGLSEIGEGYVRAMADNSVVFPSNFKHITDFTGIRVQYGYNVQKKDRPAAPSDGHIRHSIFGELLGAGGLASLNYDRRFKSGNAGLGARIGAGAGWFYSTDDPEGARYVTFPAMINYIVGKGRSGIEGGIGITPAIAFSKPVGDPAIAAIGALNLGYRLQPLKNGFMMRAVWTPLFDKSNFGAGWAGVSVGYSFK